MVHGRRESLRLASQLIHERNVLNRGKQELGSINFHAHANALANSRAHPRASRRNRPREAHGRHRGRSERIGRWRREERKKGESDSSMGRHIVCANKTRNLYGACPDFAGRSRRLSFKIANDHSAQFGERLGAGV